MLTALSLFFPYFLGLGLLTSLVSPQLSGDPPRTRHDASRHMAIVMLCGVSLNYFLVLVFRGLTTSLIAGLVLSVAGFAGAAFRRRRGLLATFRLGWARWLAVGYLLLLFALPVLFEPISDWDARSIWFFHGKMIFYQHALDLAQAARDAATSFDHLDYPKLVPVLAAQFAHLAGFWNEYFPKASLLVLLIPVLLGIFSFSDGRRTSFLFVVFFLFPFGKVVWNGYMDGYLALYAALALLFLGRWLTTPDFRDLLAGGLFLAVTVCLKNEGGLCFAAVTVGLAGMVLLAKQRDDLVRGVVEGKNALLLVAIPLGDAFLWAWRKGAWGIENDLRLGAGSLPLIRARLADGDITVIGGYLVHNGYVGRGLLVLACALILAAVLRVRPTPAVWLASAAAGLYFAGMTVVYLATPRDLQWHLENSADRTMSTVVVALFAATYFLLRGVEGDAEAAERQPEERR